MNAFGKFKDGLGEVGRGVQGVAGSVGRGVGDVAGGVQGVAGSVHHAFNAERHGERDVKVDVKNGEHEGEGKLKNDGEVKNSENDKVDVKHDEQHGEDKLKHDELEHDSSAVPPPARSFAALLSAPANVAKAALDAPRNVARKGFDVGASVAHAGFDVGASVAHAGFDVGASVAHAGLDAGSAVSHTSSTLGASVVHTGSVLGSSVTHTGSTLGTSAFNLTAAAAHSTLNAGSSITDAGINVASSLASSVAPLGAPAATIGSSIARSTLDITTSAVHLTTSTLALPSTALSAVVSAASSTPHARFEPLGVGLKALDALQVLGNEVKGDISVINGLSLDAVKAIRDMTSKALDVRGKTPTFFNPSASGIIRTTDTTLALTLLGIPKKYAAVAAHVLHALFSYPTGEAWVPLDRTLPITISRMGRTRWGKGWGDFSRVEWIEDIEIDKFLFPPSTSPSRLSPSTYLAYLTLARQGFGALLLLFEWGTTWPFYMPSIPHLPGVNIPNIQNIPLVGDVGRAVGGLGEQLGVDVGDLGVVVRKAILPTIISNYKKAHAANPNPNPAAPNAHEVPPEVVDMPGGLSG